MRDLLPDELIPPRLHTIATELTELGWYTECTEARHAWPYAVLWGDHATGARLFIRAAWGNRPGLNYTKRFPGKKYGFWFSPPPPARDRRSPWCSVQRHAPLMRMAADPFLPLPDSVWRHGFIPRQQTGCDCDKLKLHGEHTAAEALARAKAAREAGMEWRRECRYYQCPDDAQAFHLTSREVWEPEGLTLTD